MSGDESAAPQQYLDFELEIGFGQGRDYPLAVLRSPAGEARTMMHFPFDDLALENRLKDLQIALLRSGGAKRRTLTPEERVVQGFGRALFDALLTGGVRGRYEASKTQARQQGKGLRLKLHIQPPELAALPWEYLYDPDEADYLCLSTQTPVVRYLEVPQMLLPFAVRPPLRILGMFASPQGLPELSLADERGRLQAATAGLQQRGLVEVTWLEGQGWADLQRTLRKDGPWHVFHFVGHGRYDVLNGEGQIVLVDDAGHPYLLGAAQLARLLANHPLLRLVFLNACEGAQAGAQDPFSSLAAALVRHGLPAVLAMQYPITDRAAVKFAQVFYESLADGLPVDAAVSEGRLAVSLAVKNSLEWGVPVLFMRTPDGELFSRQKTEEGRQTTDDRQRLTGGDVYNINISGATGVAIGQEAQTVVAPRQPERRDAEIQALSAEIEAAVEREDWPEVERSLLQLVASGKAEVAQQPDREIAALQAIAGAMLGKEAWAQVEMCITSLKKQGLPGQVAAEEIQARLSGARQQAGKDPRSATPLTIMRRWLLWVVGALILVGVIAFSLAFGEQIAGPSRQMAAAATEEAATVVAALALGVVPLPTALLNSTFTPTILSSQTFTFTPSYTSEPTIFPKPTDLSERITDGQGVKMALIPAGEFQMGSENGDSDERPVSTVYVEALYMDIYEVTNALYERCVQAGECTPPDYASSYSRSSYYGNVEFDNYPVIYVDWKQANALCVWRRARLPTEAEWERAARGGLQEKEYPWGDETPDCQWANFFAKNGACVGDTSQVGNYSANGYGLFDMAGNVREWVSSLYKPYPYQSDDGREDPDAAGERVVRGGTWNFYTDGMRVAYRDNSAASVRGYLLGFRCSRSP